MSTKKRPPNNPSKKIGRYLLNAKQDPIDFRDYPYQPALLKIEQELPVPKDLDILDQGSEGACTGFGLAAAINMLLKRPGESRKVSPRMLYEMARKFDEWEDDDYAGSSCRGAIRGWHSMGVCSEKLAPYKAHTKDWGLTVKQAKDARETTLGAYYRVNGKRLSDYHAALCEVGVLYVSATVHEGWEKKQVKDGKIPYRQNSMGGHAFAIIGYNKDGFYVQNSWGKNWGNHGVALWSYEDWLQNIQDAWVFRLALSTPKIWHLTPTERLKYDNKKGWLFGSSPKRAEIAGHFVHIDDGKFHTTGKYWSDEHDVNQTAKLVATSGKYDHLLLYAHGGLNSIKDSARRIKAMKDIFKENKIYPYHLMYDTGLLEEIKDVILSKKRAVEERAGGFSDFTDKLIEQTTRLPGRAIWREMKGGARKPFDANGAGIKTLNLFLDAFKASDARPKKIHLVGHSTGAILLAELAQVLGTMDSPPRVSSCNLMAPACTHHIFKTIYQPLVRQRNADHQYGIDQLTIYIMSEDLELKDTVTPLYRKSLLYLVSNAFEEEIGARLLGMKIYRKYLRIKHPRLIQFEESTGENHAAPTKSVTHGGFDNDSNTMNHILKNIVGNSLVRKFTKDDLKY